MTILEKIVEKTKIRVNELKNSAKYENIKEMALSLPDNNFLFEKALKQEEISFICEVKKASPSKGIIAEEFPYIKIAKEYENAGASAVSVLTEPYFFMGRNEYLKEISENIKIPILRKDFIIDECQIYEAKLLGASAVLLICSILDGKKLEQYIKIADSLGLSALVEAHDKDEIDKALKSNPRIIGVNNRNLKTFEVDIRNSINLRKYVPDDIIFVSESGIKTPSQVAELKENKVNAVLIGETFMKSDDKKRELMELKGVSNEN